MSQTLWAAIAAGAAIAAAYIAWLVFRLQFRQIAYELARAMHLDLTTGSAAQARDRLEEYRYRRRAPGGVGDADTGKYGAESVAEVRHAYFELLWTFERLLAGRQSLSETRPRGVARPALAYFDQLISWHMAHWYNNWPELRAFLNDDMGGTLDDDASHTALDDLVSQIRQDNGGFLPVRDSLAHALVKDRLRSLAPGAETTADDLVGTSPFDPAALGKVLDQLARQGQLEKLPGPAGERSRYRVPSERFPGTAAE